jgi:hypothetical protein
VGCDYCWQHAPEFIEAEKTKRAAAHRKEYEEMLARVEARGVRGDLERAAGVKDLSNETLEELASFGGIQKILLTLRGLSVK